MCLFGKATASRSEHSMELAYLETQGFNIPAVLDRMELLLRTMGPLTVRWESTLVTGEELLEVLGQRTTVPYSLWQTYIQSVIGALWCLDYAGCRLEEVNGEELDQAYIQRFLGNKLELYLSSLGVPNAEPLHDVLLRTRLDLIRDLRRLVDEQHVRFTTIDGTTRRRVEEVVSRQSLHPDLLPPALIEEVERRWGQKFAAPATAFWSNLCEDVINSGGNPQELIRLICQAALEDPALTEGPYKPDYVIVDAPRRMDWHRPWLMDASSFWCHVEIRPDFDPAGAGLAANVRMIQRMIRARMLHNKHKAVLSYHPDQEPQFHGFRPMEITDRSTYEGAHHRGHQSAGIGAAIRAPFPLSNDKLGITLKGMADFRINRANPDGLPWSIDAVRRCLAYGIWCRAILEKALDAGFEFPDLTY